MAVTVITPTGARPEAFAECVKHARSQDYEGEVTWIVIDDGPEAMPTPEVSGWKVIHIRPEPLWQPGQNTQARNMRIGLKLAEGNVIVMEDDDWYAPWWVRSCVERLAHHPLIGESHSEYYNLKSGSVTPCRNARHASLCSTAFRDHITESFLDICQTAHKYLDMVLWRQHAHEGKLYRPEPERGVRGIKGYPGRPGIGMGHQC
jgi:hypothetical protein